MCHLVLLMPLLALPIFWLLPLDSAIPVYLLVVVTSGLLYWLIARSMVRQPYTGAESLIGLKAEVVTKLKPTEHAQYLVRTKGELWSAVSGEALQLGEMVNISALDGIRVIVARKRNDTSFQRAIVTKSC